MHDSKADRASDIFSMQNRGRSVLVPARESAVEWLERGIGSDEDVRANLAEMARLNRIGGVAALTRHLYPLLVSHEGCTRVVDLGTGAAEIPVLIGKWARRRNLPVQLFPLDFSARNMAWARENVSGDMHLLQANALRLPFAPNTVDYTISSLFLHHFEPTDVVALLRETYRSAKRGIVMSDLVRGYLPLAAFHAIAPVLARNFLTRHDGALSIRRAYAPDELASMAKQAGIPDARVYTHFPWRMTLVAVKSHV